MEQIGAQTWKELLQSVGRSVEDTGRTLRRDESFTSKELLDLQNTLETSAEVVKRIRLSATN